MDDINQPEDIEITAEVSKSSEKWSGWKGNRETDIKTIEKYNKENYPEDTRGG